ncbi:NACHT, LRR and PYD domains-containing protein 12-like isoform X1 [Osmerus mordax]|uniref:NACHT, LRR and PYD domains-containing protein 12-like isoform X1 n=1 Tax=Osmerus mordax TaxID=8014 RepID=UPI00350FDEC0
MSLSGEKEKGGSASKTSLSQEHDMDTEAESPIQQERSASPVPSCVSMKSDRSMGPPPKFSDGDGPADENDFTRIKQQRSASPVPSCVSMKSDRSMGPPPKFSDGDGPADEKEIKQQRSASSVPSCVSMKSDRSMGPPPNFSDGDGPADENDFNRIKQQRPASPVPSCVSMKSGRSMGPPPKFSDGDGPADENEIKQQRSASPVPSCVSMKSDRSMGPPPKFSDGGGPADENDKEKVKSESDQSHHEDVSSIFMQLEEAAITFFKYELRRLQQVLSSDLPEGGQHQMEDQDIVDPEYQKQESSAKKGALKITLHLLRIMNQKELADKLERNELLVICQRQLKSKLKNKFKNVFEGINKGKQTPLSKVYTDLYITEDDEKLDDEQMRQIEKASINAPKKSKTAITCSDMFKPSPEQNQPIRTVLTKGDAGVGKTFSVHQFIMDWAEGRANQDIKFIFPLPFRELNQLKEATLSLMGLLHYFLVETKDFGISDYNKYNTLFVFDGLDECRLPLDFQNNKSFSDVTQQTSVDELLTNLIKGNLLPSASIWITTRAAGASEIPSEYVDRVTVVQGFNESQKAEYFMKRISDENMAKRIISHITKSVVLNTMSEVPVFSWTSATVLEDMLNMDKSGEMPKTVTEMYTHFLVLQTKQKNVKYHGKTETDPHWDEESIKTIYSLGEMAFQQLNKGNLHFYEEDLMQCGINLQDASWYSGVFTQIFKEQRGLYHDKVFRFTYQSMQEYLAALFVSLMFINKNENWIHEPHVKSKKAMPLSKLHKAAVDKALRSPNGHMDFFLRFLLGLSVESNQKLLRGILTQTGNGHEKTVEYIKKQIRKNPSPERCMNLFHCLNELNDQSLGKEIQHYLSSGSLSNKKLSPTQWSALVFVLLTSEETMDVFDLKKYFRSETGLLKLLPVVKGSKKVLLDNCNLSKNCCKDLASALSGSKVKELDLSNNNLQDSGVKMLCSGLGQLQLERLRLSHCGVTKEGCALLVSALSNPSSYKELDLSYNHLRDSGVELISSGLNNPYWKLETLRLSGCLVTEKGCVFLATALKSNPDYLRELDLSNNDLQDSGVKLLSDELGNSQCKLETLRLSGCLVTEKGCDFLATALKSNPDYLRELDLSNNDLQDSGVKLLSDELGNSQCKLETLRLSGCMITEEGCASLASALRLYPSHLKELDLSYNNPGEKGLELLSVGLKDPQSKLKKLNVDNGGEHRIKPGLRKYACKLTLDPNTTNKRLSLSEKNKKVTWGKEKQPYHDHPERFEGSCPQVLCREGLSGRCYWEAEWSGGGVSIGVAYKSIRRHGAGEDCRFGSNDKSWSLVCRDKCYLWHNDESIGLPFSQSHRVGVYLDWPAGTLSFYTVSSDTLTHLHTFHTTFTEPLYPGFRAAYDESSVFLCLLE